MESVNVSKDTGPRGKLTTKWFTKPKYYTETYSVNIIPDKNVIVINGLTNRINKQELFRIKNKQEVYSVNQTPKEAKLNRKVAYENNYRSFDLFSALNNACLSNITGTKPELNAKDMFALILEYFFITIYLKGGKTPDELLKIIEQGKSFMPTENAPFNKRFIYKTEETLSSNIIYNAIYNINRKNMAVAISYGMLGDEKVPKLLARTSFVNKINYLTTSQILLQLFENGKFSQSYDTEKLEMTSKEISAYKNIFGIKILTVTNNIRKFNKQEKESYNNLDIDETMIIVNQLYKIIDKHGLYKTPNDERVGEILTVFRNYIYSLIIYQTGDEKSDKVKSDISRIKDGDNKADTVENTSLELYLLRLVYYENPNTLFSGNASSAGYLGIIYDNKGNLRENVKLIPKKMFDNMTKVTSAVLVTEIMLQLDIINKIMKLHLTALYTKMAEHAPELINKYGSATDPESLIELDSDSDEDTLLNRAPLNTETKTQATDETETKTLDTEVVSTSDERSTDEEIVDENTVDMNFLFLAESNIDISREPEYTATHDDIVKVYNITIHEEKLIIPHYLSYRNGFMISRLIAYIYSAPVLKELKNASIYYRLYQILAYKVIHKLHKPDIKNIYNTQIYEEKNKEVLVERQKELINILKVHNNKKTIMDNIAKSKENTSYYQSTELELNDVSKLNDINEKNKLTSLKWGQLKNKLLYVDRLRTLANNNTEEDWNIYVKSVYEMFTENKHMFKTIRKDTTMMKNVINIYRKAASQYRKMEKFVKIEEGDEKFTVNSLTNLDDAVLIYTVMVKYNTNNYEILKNLLGNHLGNNSSSSIKNKINIIKTNHDINYVKKWFKLIYDIESLKLPTKSDLDKLINSFITDTVNKPKIKEFLRRYFNSMLSKTYDEYILSRSTGNIVYLFEEENNEPDFIKLVKSKINNPKIIIIGTPGNDISKTFKKVYNYIGNNIIYHKGTTLGNITEYGFNNIYGISDNKSFGIGTVYSIPGFLPTYLKFSEIKPQFISSDGNGFVNKESFDRFMKKRFGFTKTFENKNKKNVTVFSSFDVQRQKQEEINSFIATLRSLLSKNKDNKYVQAVLKRLGMSIDRSATLYQNIVLYSLLITTFNPNMEQSKFSVNHMFENKNQVLPVFRMSIPTNVFEIWVLNNYIAYIGKLYNIDYIRLFFRYINGDVIVLSNRILQKGEKINPSTVTIIESEGAFYVGESITIKELVDITNS